MAMARIVAVARVDHSAQFSNFRPGTREYSRVLLLTKVMPRAKAVEAICVSCGPMGVPCDSSHAPSPPKISAVRRSTRGIDRLAPVEVHFFALQMQARLEEVKRVNQTPHADRRLGAEDHVVTNAAHMYLGLFESIRRRQ
jgi:hypothetical protein